MNLALTIRTEVNTAPNMTLSEAIEFAARFRVLETKMIQMGLFVLNVTEKYSQVERFILAIYFMA